MKFTITKSNGQSYSFTANIDPDTIKLEDGDSLMVDDKTIHSTTPEPNMVREYFIISNFTGAISKKSLDSTYSDFQDHLESINEDRDEHYISSFDAIEDKHTAFTYAIKRKENLTNELAELNKLIEELRPTCIRL